MPKNGTWYFILIGGVISIVAIAGGIYFFFFLPLQNIPPPDIALEDTKPVLQMATTSTPTISASSSQTEPGLITSYKGPLPSPYDPSVKKKAIVPTVTPDQQRETDLSTIKKALTTYANGNKGLYPSSLLENMPTDPSTKQAYLYYVANDFKSFTICATLSTNRYACLDSNLSWVLRFNLNKIKPWVTTWSTYTNPLNIYSFSYPSSWKQSVIKDSPTQWVSQGAQVGLGAEDEKGKDLTDLGGGLLNIALLEVRQITAEGSYNFNDYIQNFINQAQQDQTGSGSTIKDFINSPITYSGRSATKLSYTWVDKGLEVVTTVYLIPTSEKTGIYVRMGVVPSKAFEKILHSTVDQVLNSVHI